MTTKTENNGIASVLENIIKHKNKSYEAALDKLYNNINEYHATKILQEEGDYIGEVSAKVQAKPLALETIKKYLNNSLHNTDELNLVTGEVHKLCKLSFNHKLELNVDEALTSLVKKLESNINLY